MRESLRAPSRGSDARASIRADATTFLSSRTSLKPAPDTAAAEVLGAEQSNADVDSNHVRVDPTRVRVEGVCESVASVDALAELRLHGPQRPERDVRREHQRAAGSARDHGAVDGLVA